MGLVLNLAETLDTHAIGQSLQAAPPHMELRHAATEVIAAIHGLPEVRGAELSQIEVYLGRAGAAASFIKNRWTARFEAFGRAPSSVALVVFRAPTSFVRGYRWERAAQLVLRSLQNNKALCCANALTGDSGRWPPTAECAIYLVARRRKGPVGGGRRGRGRAQ